MHRAYRVPGRGHRLPDVVLESLLVLSGVYDVWLGDRHRSVGETGRRLAALREVGVATDNLAAVGGHASRELAGELVSPLVQCHIRRTMMSGNELATLLHAIGFGLTRLDSPCRSLAGHRHCHLR